MKRQTPTPLLGTVATGLAMLQQRASGAAKARLLGGAPPIIVGASKSQGEEVLRQALEAGMRHFGENKVQEAQGKWPALKKAYPDITLHLIGPLQSNKAKEAVLLFDVIQTIDRPKIADTVAAEASRQGRDVKVLIQVNTGEEPQKGGVSPRDLPALIEHYKKEKLPGLMGLMCVPPALANPAPHFALLQKLSKEYALPWLSMGMSNDFETAIRFGATHIRIGTALFGERKN